MKIKVFCGWGEASDVGINIERTEEEAARYVDSHLHTFVDLTAQEARIMAAELISAAESAEGLEQLCKEHNEKGR